MKRLLLSLLLALIVVSLAAVPSVMADGGDETVSFTHGTNTVSGFLAISCNAMWLNVSSPDQNVGYLMRFYDGGIRSGEVTDIVEMDIAHYPFTNYTDRIDFPGRAVGGTDQKASYFWFEVWDADTGALIAHWEGHFHPTC